MSSVVDLLLSSTVSFPWLLSVLCFSVLACFLSSYSACIVLAEKVVGRGFEITDYGICYVEDMLAEVPENTIIVDGTGHAMILSLPRRGTSSVCKRLSLTALVTP